ncbi:MAG: hypothetical protein M1820_009972 [Bogoriella megaspora]|nr:MAG: hypothetical protein M1820_009972 [Bogoriella megaspora]
MHSATLDLEPSCIAFSPDTDDCFVVGTYHLHKLENTLVEAASKSHETEKDSPNDPGDLNTQIRGGTVVLFTLDNDKPILRQTLDLGLGILDIAFSHTISTSRPARLAIAATSGTIAFTNLLAPSPAKPIAQLANLEIHQPFDPSVLVLDIVWRPTRPSEFAVSLSTGAVVLCSRRSEVIAEDEGVSLEPESQLVFIETTIIFKHSLEAWTVAFGCDGRFTYSGGDDGVFACLDAESREDGGGNDEEENLDVRKLWQDRKIHGAGVTAILPLFVEQDASGGAVGEVMLTGSYDDHVRVVLAPRQRGRRPTVLAQRNLDGGVWRLKVIEDGEIVQGRWIVLASCMYAGVRIIEVKQENGECKIGILAKFEGHKSMNYGSDVRPRKGNREVDSYEIVSTSFYDKLMCVWKFDQKAEKDSC